MSETESHPALALEGELNIYGAAENKLRILEFLSRAKEAPALDLSAVTEVDTAGLQLLILAQREAESMGTSLRLLDPSASVLDVLQLCNLTTRFDVSGALECNP